MNFVQQKTVKSWQICGLKMTAPAPSIVGASHTVELWNMSHQCKTNRDQGNAGYHLYTALGSSLAPFPQLSSTILPMCAICGSAAACRCAWESTNSAWTATAGSCHFCRWRMESTSYSSPKTWPSKGHTLTCYVFLYTHKLCSRFPPKIPSPQTIWSWIITLTVQLSVFACVGRV